MRPESAPQLFETHCLGKDRFPSESSAWAYITAARSRGRRVVRLDRADGLHAYKCKFTGPGEEHHWHVGH